MFNNRHTQKTQGSPKGRDTRSRAEEKGGRQRGKSIQENERREEQIGENTMEKAKHKTKLN